MTRVMTVPPAWHQTHTFSRNKATDVDHCEGDTRAQAWCYGCVRPKQASITRTSVKIFREEL
jgi:hypothetical protein